VIHRTMVQVVACLVVAGLGALARAQSTPEIDRELAKAEAVLRNESRDAAVSFLRQAIAAREQDPYAIVLHFRMASMLTDINDTRHKSPSRPLEGLREYEEILRRYKHGDYYTDSPAIDGTWAPQFIVPRAALKAANITRGTGGPPEEARQHLRTAMTAIKETYDRRLNSIRDEPRPTAPGQDGGPVPHSSLEEKWPAMVEAWERRQAAAREGNVLSSFELETAGLVVREFGFTSGPHGPEGVALAMSPILKEFPGTPMARIAQGHIDKAERILDRKRVAALPEGFDEVQSDAASGSEGAVASPIASANFTPGAVNYESPVGQPETTHFVKTWVLLSIVAIGLTLLVFKLARSRRSHFRA
jgi:hypothetical protein